MGQLALVRDDVDPGDQVVGQAQGEHGNHHAVEERDDARLAIDDVRRQLVPGLGAVKSAMGGEFSEAAGEAAMSALPFGAGRLGPAAKAAGAGAATTIVDANQELSSNPALINTDPFGKGWLFVLKIDNADDLKNLKDAAAYKKQIG